MFLSFLSNSAIPLQPLTNIRMLIGILTITSGNSNPPNSCQTPTPSRGTITNNESTKVLNLHSLYRIAINFCGISTGVWSLFQLRTYIPNSASECV